MLLPCLLWALKMKRWEGRLELLRRLSGAQ